MIYVLDPTSNDFKVDEAKICTDMGSKLWSLTNCYVDERTCNDLGSGVSMIKPGLFAEVLTYITNLYIGMGSIVSFDHLLT